MPRHWYWRSSWAGLPSAPGSAADTPCAGITCLLGYALAEGVIGLFALFFHPLFDQAVLISYDHVIPHLHSVVAANLYKWTLSVLLILPQSFLLGMTFPLMSAGALRIASAQAGTNHRPALFYQ